MVSQVRRTSLRALISPWDHLVSSPAPTPTPCVDGASWLTGKGEVGSLGADHRRLLRGGESQHGGSRASDVGQSSEIQSRSHQGYAGRKKSAAQQGSDATKQADAQGSQKWEAASPAAQAPKTCLPAGRES